jgi:hypothetical protein
MWASQQTAMRENPSSTLDLSNSKVSRLHLLTHREKECKVDKNIFTYEDLKLDLFTDMEYKLSSKLVTSLSRKCFKTC